MSFFLQFEDASSKVENGKFKNADQMNKKFVQDLDRFFPNPELITDFLFSESYPKVTDQSDMLNWQVLFARLLKDPNMSRKALFDKTDSSMIPCEQIMID